MATQNTINVGINVSDNGTAKQTIKSFKDLQAAIEGAQKTAAKGVPVGGTPGSRSVAAKAGPNLLTYQEYGQARGASGITGASARDFANQAQGLGGLVRLYATYAANVFAVGAAFRALSSAMDTTNMVRGLNQLGAASGTALGSLSKDFAAATDGAISLREAMEATVKASSSGMNSEQILRMADVAKKASLALGVDMADAVSRISRGITKLEPELLDEIGLFTKTGAAAEAYAKSVGKTVTQLTDFERRQAFANAVLEEGERKFGAIDMESNPYTQLLATVKDLSQAGLELVNKVLVPVVRFLSENPTALVTVLAGLVGVLIKQAIPAIGEFKAAMQSAADRSREIAEQRAQDAQLAIQRLQQIIKTDKANAWDAAINSLDKVEARLKDVTPKASAALQKLFNAHDIDEFKSAIGTANRSIAQLENQLSKAVASGASSQVIANLKERIQLTKEWVAGAKEAITTQENWEKVAKNGIGVNRAVEAQQLAALKAQEAAIKSAIISNASYNASLVGLTGAFKLLSADINASGLTFTGFGGTVHKAMLYARGGVAILTSSIVGLAAALGNIFAVIGIAVAVFNMLDSALSKTAKQSKEFDSSLDRANKSIQTLADTIDNINDKPFAEQLNADSMLAKANAIGEVTSSITKLIAKTEKQQEATESSGWDNFIDKIKSFWGGDIQSKFTEQLTNTIKGALEELEGSSEGEKLRKTLASILSLPEDFSLGSLDAAIANLEKGSPELSKISLALKILGNEFLVAANKSKEFDEQLTKGKEAYKAFASEFAAKDTFSKLGNEILTTAGYLSKAFEEPTTALEKLYKLSNDIDALSLFDNEDANRILAYKNQIEGLNEALAKNRQANSDAEKEVLKYQEQLDQRRQAFQKGDGSYYTDEEIKGFDSTFVEIERKLQDAIAKSQALKAEAAKLQADTVSLVNKFPNLAVKQFELGASYIGKSIEAASSKVGSAFAGAVNSVLGDIPGTAKRQAEMQNAQLSVQIELLEAQRTAIVAVQENNAFLRVRNAQEAVKMATEESTAERRRLGLPAGMSENDARKQLQEAETALSIIKGATSGTTKQVNTLIGAIKDGTLSVGKDTASILQYIQNISGLNTKIAELRDQQAANNFTAEIKAISERANEVKREVNLRIQSLEIDTRIIQQQQQLGTISEESAIEKLKQLEIQKDIEQSSLRQIDIATEYESISKAIRSGILSSEQKITAEARLKLLAERQIVEQKDLQVKTNQAQRNAEQQLRKLAKERFDLETKISRMKQDTAQLTKDKELELARLELDILKESGSISPDELQAREYALELLKLENEAVKEKIQLERAYQDQVQTLLEEWVRATEERRKYIQQELIELSDRYETEIAYVDKLKDKRRELLEEQEFNKSWGWLTDGLSDAVSAAFSDGLKSGWDKLKDTFKQKIKVEFDASVKANVKGFVKDLVKGNNSAVNSMFANFKSGNLVAAGGNLFSAVSGFTQLLSPNNFLSGQMAKFGSFLAKMGFDATSSLLTNFASGMIYGNTIGLKNLSTAFKQGGATLAGNIVGRGLNGMQALAISDFISGGYKTGANSLVKAATAVSAFIFGPIAGVVGGVFNRAFGRKLKDWGIEGTFSGAEGFKGNQYQFHKGGWFRSDKTKRQKLDKDLARIINAEMKLIYEGGKVAAKTLGLTAEQISGALDNLSIAVKFSTKGADTQEKFQKALQKGYDQVANTLGTVILNTLAYDELVDKAKAAGSISLSQKEIDKYVKNRIASLTKTGETSSETLVRLANSLRAANEMFGLLDMKLYEASLAGAEMASTLVDMAGGMEKFVENNKFFLENFFTQAEQYELAFNNVRNLFMGIKDSTELAFSDRQKQAIDALFDGVGDARREFRNLVASLDTTTEQGQQAYTTLMQLAPAFAGITPPIEDASVAVSNLALSLSTLDTSELSTILSEALTGNMDDIGLRVGNAIRDSVFKSLTDNFVGQLVSVINTNLLTPILTSTVQGTTITAAINQEIMDAFVEEALTKANAIAEILNNPEFQQAILKISSTVASVFSSVGGIFSQVEYKFKDLGFAEIEQELVKAYEAEVQHLEKQKQLLTEQQSTLKSTVDTLKSFTKSIKDFKDSLLLGDKSPLSPAEQYAEAKRQFDSIAALAASGDEDAQDKLQGAASAFLEASRNYFASSDQYTSDFDSVQAILDSVISGSEAQLSEAERQLAALDEQISQLDAQISAAREQIDILNGIDTTIKSIEEALLEAQRKNELAYQNGIDQTVEGFTSLDKNLDGILTVEELKASGMASDERIAELHQMMDTNGDGQITILEAISGASENTMYTLYSVEGILQAVRNDQLTYSQAESLIAQLIAANQSKGGSAPGEQMVKSAYENILGREAEDAGLAHWAKQVLYGEIKPENLSRNIAISGLGSGGQDAQKSAEWLVTEEYKQLLGRAPDQSGLEHWSEMLTSGRIGYADLKENIAYEAFNVGEITEAVINVLRTKGGMFDLYDEVVYAYKTALGRSGIGDRVSQIDPGGLKYWMQQLHSMGITSKDEATGKIAAGALEFLKNNPDNASSKYIRPYLTAYYGGTLPAFAVGTNYVPEDMPAIVHRGERIIPAADNEKLFKAVGTKENTDRALLEEIRKLNEKIDSLEQTVAEGSLMNVQATDRNTKEISNSVKETASTSQHAEQVRRRASLT